MVHKLHKHWANSVQANCDWRQSSWPSSSLSLEEVVVYLHRRVLWPSIFLIFIVWMNWRTLQPTDSLLKAATNYDELPYSVSPNPQEAIVALPSFQLLCHRCFDRPRRWKWYWETSLLRESCFKECGDLLPKAERTCLAIRSPTQSMLCFNSQSFLGGYPSGYYNCHNMIWRRECPRQ